MIYCINPECSQRQNSDDQSNCYTCNTLLLVKDRYKLIKPLHELHRFRFAEVFEIKDIYTNAPKVLKILKTNHSKLIQLFKREAQVLQSLDHSGIPRVKSDEYFPFPSAEKPRAHCLIMEKVEGQNLEQWLEEHQLTCQERTLNWLKQLVDILEQIHQNQFFHRDIKPSNIILRPNGKLVLIDFGAVRQSSETLLSGRDMTAILTPGYAPPEQLNRKAIPQSDFYALGRTFAHLLTKKHPIECTEDNQGCILWREHLPPQFSPLLADLIDDLMALSAYDRPRNIHFIRKRIEQIENLSSTNILSSLQRQIVALSRFKLWKNQAFSILMVTVSVGVACWWLFKPNPNSFIQVAQKVTNISQGKVEVASIISDPKPQQWQLNRSSGNFSLDSIPLDTFLEVEVTNLNGSVNSAIRFNIKYDISLAKDSVIAWDVCHRTTYKKPDGPTRSLYIADPRGASNQFRVRIYRLN